MAARVIKEAISVGAPAYNAGSIALCADIYEAAAAQLLGTFSNELAKEVIRSLDVALATSQRLRSGARTFDNVDSRAVEQLAWSFRRSFDAQLRGGQLVSTGRDAIQTKAQSPAQFISQAVELGAPMYNRGDVAGCARIYAETAKSLLERDDLDASARSVLWSALQQSRNSMNMDSNAWALRRAIDVVAGGSPLRARTPQKSPRRSGGASRGTLLRDFATGDGIATRGTVVNDTVMGGRSNSRLSSAAGGAVFEGTVTRAGGGGFVSVRFDIDSPSFARLVRGRQGVAVQAAVSRGCSAWKFQLLEGSNGISWQADFTASNGDGMQRIPFSAMIPTFRGMPQGRGSLGSDGLERIRGFGFMLSFLTANGRSSGAFEEGPFSIMIKRIEVY
eukprot:TRINITY_DN75078_c0_g1_i1.p1 TRINITY_DN75078_c0_g1~~TRINITY_DN75078_c0_g1_i1.p1  ORF type:complete len:438 (+),score=53.68 TRINITY_DN75078_c0_g1_i1:145-1314(+)